MTTLSPIRAEQAEQNSKPSLAYQSEVPSNATADAGIYGYCSWHGGWFDRETGQHVKRDVEAVTHTICRECSRKLLDEAKQISKSVKSVLSETSAACCRRD